MSFMNPDAARGLRMLLNLGFDRVWFALAVIVSLFIAAEVASLLLPLLAPMPAH